jgi:Predicted metal-binding integral membrane protein (DUF2182)
VSAVEPRLLAEARARLGLVAFLVVLAAVAWWSTIRSMAGMAASPGADLGALGWFVSVWIVMMAAMMLPAVSPTVALYARMTRRRGPMRPLVFTSSYLLIWGAAGIAAYGLFALGRHTLGTDLAWGSGGRWVAACLLTVAAVYELTPLKDVCLGKCRSPFGFLLGEWRLSFISSHLPSFEPSLGNGRRGRIRGGPYRGRTKTIVCASVREYPPTCALLVEGGGETFLGSVVDHHVQCGDVGGFTAA